MDLSRFDLDVRLHSLTISLHSQSIHALTHFHTSSHSNPIPTSPLLTPTPLVIYPILHPILFPRLPCPSHLPALSHLTISSINIHFPSYSSTSSASSTYSFLLHLLFFFHLLIQYLSHGVIRSMSYIALRTSLVTHATYCVAV